MASKEEKVAVIAIVLILVATGFLIIYTQSMTKAPPDKVLLSLTDLPGEWNMTLDVSQYYNQTGQLSPEIGSLWLANRVFHNANAHYIVNIYIACMNSTSDAIHFYQSVKSSVGGYWPGWQNTTYGDEGAVAHYPGFFNGYFHIFREANIFAMISIDNDGGSVIDNMSWMDELLSKQVVRIDQNIPINL